MWLSSIFNGALNFLGMNDAPTVRKEGVDIWYSIGSNKNIVSVYSLSDIEYVYYKCSTLQSVILNKAQCKANARWYLVDDKGNKSNSLVANEIMAFMRKPNVLQSYSEFRAEAASYTQIYGYCIIWYVPNGSPFGIGLQNIWVLNPVDCVIKYKGTGVENKVRLEEIIESITYYYSGMSINVPVQQVAFVKDQTTRTSRAIQQSILPTSRIYGLELVVSNNIASYDARNSMIVNRGQQGFISNSTRDAASYIPLLPDEKELLQREWDDYGVLRGQKKVLITGKDLKWNSTVIPTRDLMLFEESEETICRIVDVYGYQIQLLAAAKKSSIGSQNETQKEARKNLYLNTIIPEDISEISMIFSGFNLEKYGLHVECDYSHIPELHGDQKVKEEVSAIRVQSIEKINAMNIRYENKINIAMLTMDITEEQAKLIIDNESNK